MGLRFSVLIPVYNREKYIAQAIDSVLGQTCQDFELFAVDDGSTDRSAEILRAYGARIHFLQQRNQGPEVARNKAAAMARGEYLVFLDSDDFFFPFAFETFEQIIRKFESPPLILGSMLFHEEGSPLTAPSARPVSVYKFADYLAKTRSLGTNAIVVRKSVFDEVGGLRNSTPQTFHGDDTNLLLKVGTYGPCIVIESPYTSVYRLHGKNSTKDNKAIADAIVRLAQTERQGGFGGGSQRKKDRYAYIGGRAASWAFHHCWREGQRMFALRLLAATAPMVGTAVWNKMWKRVTKSRPAVESIRLA